MKTTAIFLATVRRGAAPDELELVDSAGYVVRLTAAGITDDERCRTRERAYQLLTGPTRAPR